MTETSSNPSFDISSHIVTKPGGQYENKAVSSTAVSVPPKAPNALRRVYVSGNGTANRGVSVAYSEKQESLGRRREEINRRMAG